jgi:mono/diheme cytochrome c family protein
MRRFALVSSILLGLLFLGTSLVYASGPADPAVDLVAGAQLYDNWFAATRQDPPAGDSPIWSRQSTNTRSGADTWRCSECHGWDYRGFQGAYASGSHYTGFPNLIQATGSMDEAQIVGHLKGQMDPAHDYSPYLTDTQLQQLAFFLKNGLIDDSRYIDDISLKVINGDVVHGKRLYDQTCSACHGADGTQVTFRGEGVVEYLGSIAKRDPWRFLHRTRFGVAGTTMPVGYQLGWKIEDGRDVLAYAQTFPSGSAVPVTEPASKGAEPGSLLGGPGNNIWSGILTGLAVFGGILGGSLVFAIVLVAVIGWVVWALRQQR